MQIFVLLNQTLLIIFYFISYQYFCIFSWAYMQTVKGVINTNVLIRGWGYTPGLLNLTLGERKPRQKLFYQ